MFGGSAFEADTVTGVGLKPNGVSYNAAMSACAKGDQWQPALEVL